MYRTSTLIADCRGKAATKASRRRWHSQLDAQIHSRNHPCCDYGFEQQKLRIDAQIAELRSMLPRGSAGIAAAPGGAPAKRKISAAALRRMAPGQQRRWPLAEGQQSPRHN
jgi:hypothetical protein